MIASLAARLVFAMLLVGFAAFPLPAPTADQAGIRLHVVSAGIPLLPGDGEVLAFTSGSGNLVGRAGLGERIPVPPGRYDLRFVVTRARDRPRAEISGVEVGAESGYESTVEVPIGELVVNAAGGRLAEEGAASARVQVFPHRMHSEAVTGMGAGERIWLGAGSYDLRVVYLEGTRELGVRWLREVVVRAGASSAVRVAFQRGKLRIDAFSGRAALPSGSTEVWVHDAGDLERRVVARGEAGVVLDLPAGHYDIEVRHVAAHDRPSRWLEGVEVPDGSAASVRVEFASGRLVVRATLNGQPLARFDAYTYVYRPGEYESPIAYLPAGDPFILAAGRYDLRLRYERSHDRPDLWLRGLEVRAGQTLRRTIGLPSARVLVRVLDPAGEELIGDEVFVFAYSSPEDLRPFAVARAGERLTFTAGPYALRIEIARTGKSYWTATQHLLRGAAAERVFRLRSEPNPGLVELASGAN